jgi:hypothetical protein
MWTPSDRFVRAGRWAARARRRGTALLGPAIAFAFAIALALALALPAPGAAQPPAPAPSRPAAAAPSLSAGARRELRQSLERMYQVTGVHNGVLLRPRVPAEGVREVEVSGDAIMVNGARVSPQVLREWLRDAAATPLLQLAELPPGERQALFGLPRDVAASGLPPAAGAAPGAASGSTSDTARGGAAGGSTAPGAAAGAGAGVTAEPEEDAGHGLPPLPPTPPTPPATPEAPAPPASPSAPPAPPPVSAGSRIRFGGPVRVEKGEVAEEVFTLGGSVHIDGEVNRDVSAVGGSVRVNGRVGGSVTAVGGSVHLGPHSEVMGDVAAVGGTVVREPGSVVHGNQSDVSRFGSWREPPDDDYRLPWLFLGPLHLHMFWSLATLLLLLLAVTLVVLLAPGTLEQVRARVAGEPWTVLAAGVLGQILVGPTLVALVVVLVISIVGCLLLVLVPFLILALLIAGLVGFAGVAYHVGRVLEGRFASRFGGPYLTTMVGVLAIETPSLIGHFLSAGGGFLHVFALMFLFFGLLLRYLAWTIGFGAALLTAFSNRPQRFRRQAPPGAPAPASPVPPPPPPAPPAGTFESPPAAAAPGGGQQ